MLSEQSAVITWKRRDRKTDTPAPGMAEFQLSQYQSDGFHDEMFDGEGRPRCDCEPLFRRMQMMTADDLVRRQRAADRSMVQLGITFNVYGDNQGRERIIPFDIVPRIIPQQRMGMARARP